MMYLFNNAYLYGTRKTVGIVYSFLTYLSCDTWFPTMWYVRPTKHQISLRIRAVWSEPLLVAWLFYDC